MDRILLNGLCFFGRHGCHAAERELGQKFVVDVELSCELYAAGKSDNLQDTVDYVSVYNAVRDIIEGEPALLLESLAQRIADFALRDEKVHGVRVRLRKPHVALPGPLDYLGVEITRYRTLEASEFDESVFDDMDFEDDDEFQDGPENEDSGQGSMIV